MDILFWLVGIALYIGAVLFLAEIMGRGLAFDDDDEPTSGMLLDSLTAQLGQRAEGQAHLLEASARRIQDAEELARQISSAGVPAVASGSIDGDSIAIWVSVGPTLVDRVENALIRLDLVESARHVTRYACEMRLQGYQVPLLIKTFPARTA